MLSQWRGYLVRAPCSRTLNSLLQGETKTLYIETLLLPISCADRLIESRFSVHSAAALTQHNRIVCYPFQMGIQ